MAIAAMQPWLSAAVTFPTDGRHDEPKALNLSMGNHGQSSGLPTCRAEPPIECAPSKVYYTASDSPAFDTLFPRAHLLGRKTISEHFPGRSGECAQRSGTLGSLIWPFRTYRRFTSRERMQLIGMYRHHRRIRPFLHCAALLIY